MNQNIKQLQIIHIDHDDNQTLYTVDYLKDDVDRMIKDYAKKEKPQGAFVHRQNAPIRCDRLLQKWSIGHALCDFKRKAQQHKPTIRPTATHAPQHRLVEGTKALPAHVYQWGDQL